MMGHASPRAADPPAIVPLSGWSRLMDRSVLIVIAGSCPSLVHFRLYTGVPKSRKVPQKSQEVQAVSLRRRSSP